MVGARLFNEKAGRPLPEVFGCVTSGEVWQFLRLSGTKAEIDHRLYIHDVGSILTVFHSILDPQVTGSKLAE